MTERKYVTLWRALLALALFSASVCFQYARADCQFTGPSDVDILFTLPSQIVISSDVGIGTQIYSGYQSGASGTISCDNGDAFKVSDGYLNTALVNTGDYIYATTVPGVGMRVVRSENMNPPFGPGFAISTMHDDGATHNWVDHQYAYNVGVELVVTGPVQTGDLDTSQFTAEYIEGGLTVERLTFTPASIHIIVNTCDLVSKDIEVPLRTISTHGFDGNYSDILSDESFKIELSNCTERTKVDYKFTSAGSTGVTGGNILNIASGQGAASGVGIQILDKNNNVLNFDQEYVGIESASGQGTEEIPLNARYVKTGTVTGGEVNAIATFEVYYR